LFHGNSFPPQRRAFLHEMIDLATADEPDVWCAQEVPGWALQRFTVGDMSSRPPLGTVLGRAITALHHGLIRGGVSGQGLGIRLGPTSTLLERQVVVLNARDFRNSRARDLGLDRAARRKWAGERRIAQVVRLSIGERTYAVANVHCTGLPGDHRVADVELMRAAEVAVSVAQPADVLVIAGDFNLRWGASQGLADLTGPEWGFSPPARGIDHILVRGASAGRPRPWPEDRRRRADGSLLSDHAPVDLVVG
jgi:endonuclease/exonuclease/phosphatase family metal-dependent hydrolase